MPGEVELPSTIERSPKHAQEIYRKTLASAIDEYGDGRRAHQTAFAAVKHEFEKVGDHWEPKGHRGPSDAGAAHRGRPTAGGVDANASKSHLLEVARRLEVKGRSSITKDELVDAIQKANARETRHARES